MEPPPCLHLLLLWSFYWSVEVAVLRAKEIRSFVYWSCTLHSGLHFIQITSPCHCLLIYKFTLISSLLFTHLELSSMLVKSIFFLRNLALIYKFSLSWGCYRKYSLRPVGVPRENVKYKPSVLKDKWQVKEERENMIDSYRIWRREQCV